MNLAIYSKNELMPSDSSIRTAGEYYSMPDENKVIKITKDGSMTPYKETTVEIRKDGSTHIMANDDEDLKAKALRAGDEVTDLVDSALDKAIDTVKTKTNELLKSGELDPDMLQQGRIQQI